MATANPAAGSSAGVSPDPLVGTRSGASSTLSPWVGDYVTNMLGEARALGGENYQAYGGPLTAGQSALQTQAFQGLGNLTLPTGAQTTYTPQMFSADAAQRYMNPYLEAALNPQISRLQREAAMKRIEDAGRLSRAGAYGGGRQAVMESLGNEATLRTIGEALGKGYQSAYDKAMEQFNVEQNREMGAAKQAGEYGLAALGAQSRAGEVQRGIESEGVAADLAEFRRQAEFPYKQLEFQRQMLSNLPIQTQSYSYNAPSDFNQAIGILTGIGTAAQNPTVKALLDSLGLSIPS